MDYWNYAVSAIKALRRGRTRDYTLVTSSFERLAHDLKDMAAELGPCIQEEHAMVGQRHVARHRHVAPADQPRIRDRMMGGHATGAW